MIDCACCTNSISVSALSFDISSSVKTPFCSAQNLILLYNSLYCLNSIVGKITHITFPLPFRSIFARSFIVYPSSLAASSTARIFSLLTLPFPFNTFDTVPCETPAFFATSNIVAISCTFLL